ncbi:uncharacterized protein RSE6_11411 [Rhynchosporium secalis]|uniref:Uncharacterized protein n=1 Tax=Rhynchosporium secalis TaxID=38038 RepID=A0A1E1MMW9_RHYSE|nr:uncharacterized protein RSE6_11411 [Rhynchosporium secalis]
MSTVLSKNWMNLLTFKSFHNTIVARDYVQHVPQIIPKQSLLSSAHLDPNKVTGLRFCFNRPKNHKSTMNPTMPYVPIENVSNEANKKPQPTSKGAVSSDEE